MTGIGKLVGVVITAAAVLWLAGGVAVPRAAVFEAPAPTPPIAAPGSFRVAQSMSAECAELKANPPEAPEKKLAWIKDVIDCLKKRDLLPPVLETEAPEEVSTSDRSFTITGLVGDDGSVPQATINGEPLELVAPAADAPSLGVNTLAFSYTVEITEDTEYRFVIEAVDADGNTVAEEITIAVVTANQPRFDGEFHALIIANAEYDFLPPVATALADGQAIAELINRRYEFDKKNINLIENATRRDLLSALGKLRKTLGIDDRLFIYYSGHGVFDEAIGAGYWQGVEAEDFDDFTWIAVEDVKRNLKGMAESSAKHVLVLSDSVFPLTTARGTKRRKIDQFFDTIDSYVSRKLIASGVATPTAAEVSGEHSVFAFSLLKVLEENQDPYITSKQLFDRMSHEILAISDQEPEWGTLSNTGDEGSGEFTFILRSEPLAKAE